MNLQILTILILLFEKSISNVLPSVRKLVCPKDWEYLEIGNTCVFIPNRNQVTYQDRIDECRKLSGVSSGGLITISGKKSEDEICAYMKRQTFSKNEGNIWLGASDQVVETKYIWEVNGKDLLYGYSTGTAPNWMKNQPNDKSGMLPQDCLTTTSDDCRWNDWECPNLLLGVCSIYQADLCSVNNGGCDHICIATGPNARNCTCKTGFELTTQTFCADIDECQSGGRNWCHNGVCNNTYGGVECKCHGNDTKLSEFVCEKLDPCTVKNGGCHHNCLYDSGEVKCTCMEGYQSNNDGRICLRVKIGLKKSMLMMTSSVLLSLASFVIFVTVLSKLMTIPESNEDNNQQTPIEKNGEEEQAGGEGKEDDIETLEVVTEPDQEVNGEVGEDQGEMQQDLPEDVNEAS